jgi:pimeloyl-ACP methyl ester carboxylesterase
VSNLAHKLSWIAAVVILTAVVGAHPAAATPHHVFERVHTISFHFPVAPGQTLHVTKYFTVKSLFRHPARAAIFLTGPAFRGNFWDIPVEGYSGPEMAARRGFFAYTLDYIGVGKSYLPEDGSEVNYLTQVAPVRKLIDFLRLAFDLDTVDLIGEAYGAEIAAELADEPQRVRSVTMSVVTYKNHDPGILGFFSPAFQSFLLGQPDGYWFSDFLALTLAHTTVQEVRDYVLETQPDFYPTGPGLQFWDLPLPIIDAPAALVPGLVILGEHDNFPAPGDPEELVADWGGGATLVTIAGAHHVPRIEAPEIAAQYFEALFDFIDP